MRARNPRRPLPLLAEPPLGCGLDTAGLEAQRQRLAALAAATTAVERRGRELHVRFAATVDARLVDEFVATERGCCPTLQLRFDRRTRRLRITSTDPGANGALELFTAAFAPPGATQ
jgi:hypothetical protein